MGQTKTRVYDNANISGGVITNNVQVYDNAIITGSPAIAGNVKIHGDAITIAINDTIFVISTKVS